MPTTDAWNFDYFFEMGKSGASHNYSLKLKQNEGFIRAKGSNIRVRYKNLVETANSVRNMSLARAQAYLKNILARKECVPFKIFKSGVGRCPQAKQFGRLNGRWPKNSAKCLIDLLRNATANCEFYGKDPADFYVYHIQVNEAPKATRRTYRAHGRINPYMRHLSHVQLILKEKIA